MVHGRVMVAVMLWLNHLESSPRGVRLNVEGRRYGGLYVPSQHRKNPVGWTYSESLSHNNCTLEARGGKCAVGSRHWQRR